MIWKRALFAFALLAAAGILARQLLLPPVIGLADQGDFRRMIGRFGFGPSLQADRFYAYVSPQYVPDKSFRLPDWEQVSSEYLFIKAGLFLNKLIAKDNSLDIRVIGFVHALAFLAALARFLFVTRRLRAWPLLWIAAVGMFTDVGYVAYWNSFYAEPASFLFGFLLVTEAIEWCVRGHASWPLVARWSLWTVLFALAKPQNIVISGLLALVPLWRSGGRQAQLAARVGAAAVAVSIAVSLFTAPKELKNSNTFNLVFLGILNESHNPSKDLEALGLDPQLRDQRGLGAWSPGSLCPYLIADGAIGHKVTLATVVKFYALRPARVWRHVKTLLHGMMSLRPELGNFEPSAGQPRGAQSQAFALWSGFHDHVLSPVSKFVLFALLLFPLAVLLRAILRARRPEIWMEFVALLSVCALIAFLTAAFGDAWENVKHMFLFNALTDLWLLSVSSLAYSAAYAKVTSLTFVNPLGAYFESRTYLDKGSRVRLLITRSIKPYSKAASGSRI
jgi:hypothetical protein